jgi:hypothetical protein
MDAFFTLAGYIVVLVVLSIGVSIGIIFLALSSTPFSRAIPIVSAIFLPVALVIGLSGLGYLHANQIAINGWRIIVPIGIIITFFVFLKRWKQINKVIFTRVMAFSAMSGIASFALFSYLNSTESFAYNYLGNGEFLNYASLASAMIDPRPTLSAFFEFHRTLRFGQDIVLAVMADLFKKNPIELVHIASGYLLFAYGSVVGFVITTVFGVNRLTALLLLIHGVMLTVLFNFSASFFSSSIILPSAILILAYSTSSVCVIRAAEIPNSYLNRFFYTNIIGVTLLLITYIVFIAITYPEFGFPVLGASVGLASYQSYRSRALSLPLVSLILAIVVVFILNPFLIIGALKGFYGQLSSGGGWNVFGDPRYNLTFFLSNISGLSFPLTKQHIATNQVVSILILIAWVVVSGLAFWRNGKTGKPGTMGPLALWMVFAIFVLFSPFLSGRNWYPAAKYFSQFSIGVILVLGWAFGIGVNEQAAKFSRNISRITMLSIFGLFLTVNTHQVVSAKQEIEILNFNAWTDALKKIDKKLPLAVFNDREGEVIWFAEIVAKNAQVTLLPISTGQIDRLARRAPSSLSSSCKSKEIPVGYDLSSWPYSTRELLAIVGAQDTKALQLQSDHGFDVSVQSQETVARLGTLRIDRVSFGATKQFLFQQDSWVVDGIWTACVMANNDYVTVTIDVPEALVHSEPLDVVINVGNEVQGFRIKTSGRHVLLGNAPRQRGVPELVVVKTFKNWTPREIDPSSTDTRKLGVKVLALNI